MVNKKPTRQRGRPRTLSKAAVADAALSVLDRDGFAGLSLRAVARELDVHPSTLYTYASGVEELRAMLADAVAGQLEPPRGDVPPREALAVYFRGLAEQGARHPRLIEMAGFPAGSATRMGHVEACLEHLMALGLNTEHARVVYAILLYHTIGATVSRTAAERFSAPDDPLTSGNVHELPVLRRLLTEGLPTPAQAYEQEIAAILDVLVPALGAGQVPGR